MISDTFKRAISVSVIASLLYSTSVTPVLAYMNRLPPKIFNQMYALAARGDVVRLAAAVHRGLDLEAVNEDGNTALCVAVKYRNKRAYNTLVRVGAREYPPCRNKYPWWNRFAQAEQKVTRDEGFVWWPWLLGIGLVGIVAIVAGSGGGGGGGGGGSSGDSATTDNGGTTDNGTDNNSSDNSGTDENDNGLSDGLDDGDDGSDDPNDLDEDGSDDPNDLDDSELNNEDDGSYEQGPDDPDEEVIPTAFKLNVYANQDQALYNGEKLEHSADGWENAWGGIWVEHLEYENNGSITLTSADNFSYKASGFGIMSCLTSLNSCLRTEATSLAGDIYNYGNMTITSPNSLAIFASTAAYDDPENEDDYSLTTIKSTGNLTLDAENVGGIAVIGDAAMDISGQITLNTKVTNSTYRIIDDIYYGPTYGYNTGISLTGPTQTQVISSIKNSAKINITALQDESAATTENAIFSVYGILAKIHSGYIENNGQITISWTPDTDAILVSESDPYIHYATGIYLNSDLIRTSERTDPDGETTWPDYPTDYKIFHIFPIRVAYRSSRGNTISVSGLKTPICIIRAPSR